MANQEIIKFRFQLRNEDLMLLIVHVLLLFSSLRHNAIIISLIIHYLLIPIKLWPCRNLQQEV